MNGVLNDSFGHNPSCQILNFVQKILQCLYFLEETFESFVNLTMSSIPLYFRTTFRVSSAFRLLALGDRME